MAAPPKSYENPQPWEEHQGPLAVRVAKVSREAQRIYAQQAAILPTIHHEHTVDPAIPDHLQDVGHRIQILHDNAKKPDKKALKIAERQEAHKRVIPSRFPEGGCDDDDGEVDGAMIQGQIETMIMDQEWDTRSWNTAKTQVACETLYDQVEHSDDPARRDLATTMLIRLLETHESAVDFVESTIPILMNKAFRNISKIVNKAKIFHMCTLLSVLSEWFVPIISRDNAVGKCIKVLLREPELCARIVQHHWRGVLFERSLKRREVDPSVHTRLRSMHFIKNVELRHQFKVLRDVMGPGGLPLEAVCAYVKILFHLVKPIASAIDKNRRHVATADQKRILSSGILVLLASLIPTNCLRIPFDQREGRRAITEHVKEIALELTVCFTSEADKIIEILKSNIIQRVVGDLEQLLQPSALVSSDDQAFVFVRSAVEVVATVARAVWQLYNQHTSSAAAHTTAETSFLQTRLQVTACQFLMTRQVMQTLLLVVPVARQRHDAALWELALSTLRYLSGSYGFASLLDALTANGGRALEQIVMGFEYDQAPPVVHAAVALFHDMTNHPDARAGFTTAGAVRMLSKWCDTGIENTKNQPRFVLALSGLALLTRQRPSPPTSVSSGNLLASLDSLSHRLEALYGILLELVSGSSRETQAAALYLHQTGSVFVPIILRFLVQVKPNDMEPMFQTRVQRSISCIVLSRFFKVSSLASAAFCESTVIHLALSLQCNRLDEIEGKLRPSRTTMEARRLHFLGLKEACKALSRLARCPPQGVDVTLKPTITSVNVPLLPQAIVCDVVTRMHVLEDILPLIYVPTDAAEFPEVDVAMVHAAIELVGYLRPMPFGEVARQQFLQATEAQSHSHGKYANDKLEMLVAIAAPMVLHVLKEKNCGNALTAICCASLSRLAATNHCRSLLLSQGGLFIALSHLPEVLFDSQSPGKRNSPANKDTSVDDDALIDVPASLFTLLSKLCAIAEGRTAMMAAQVLPRVLKRLQLTNHRSRNDDLEVKSEIAGLIQRLAMCHAVEGNTSDLFLHFNVLELLAQIAIGQLPPVASPVKKATHISRSIQSQWRALDQIVGAIAALAQDVLVCVPKIVELDLMARLTLLWLIDKHQNQQIESLHRHLVNISWAIASYPFGEYHSYLAHVQVSDSKSMGSESLTERLKKIAFDFSLELQGGTRSAENNQKTIGELARETLALIRGRSERQQTLQSRQRTLPPPHGRSSRPSSPATKPHTQSRQPTPGKQGGFPCIPGSPKRSPATPTTEDMATTPLSKRSEPLVLVPLASPTSFGVGSLLNGVDLLSTRPPIPQTPNDPLPSEAHFVFARPVQNQEPMGNKSKHKHKSKNKPTRDVSEQFLMLDPLFQSAPSSSHNHSIATTSQRDRRGSRERGSSRYIQ